MRRVEGVVVLVLKKERYGPSYWCLQQSTIIRSVRTSVANEIHVMKEPLSNPVRHPNSHRQDGVASSVHPHVRWIIRDFLYVGYPSISR